MVSAARGDQTGGRTTWWKIFANIRKAFVVFNAIIGIMAILSTIDEEISIASIVNILNAYLAKFKSYGINVIQWILDKVGLVPTPPDDSYPTSPGTVWSKDQIERIKDLNRQKAELDKAILKLDEYKNLNQQRAWSSWFSWLLGSSDNWIPSWFWYTGVVVVGAGILFLGFKLFTDPYNSIRYVSSNKDNGSTGAGPDIVLNDATTSAAESTAKAAANVAEGVGEAVGNGLFSWFTPLTGIRYIANTVIGGVSSSFNNNVAKALNPFNWTPRPDVSEKEFQSFLKEQKTSSIHSDRRFYPFTADNPYDSWITRARVRFPLIE